MRLVTRGPVELPVDLQDASRICLAPDTLKSVHGGEMSISDWNDKGRRTLKFFVDRPQEIPALLKAFIPRESIGMLVVQEKRSDETTGSLELKNKIRLDMLGQEIVKIRPKFRFHANGPKSTLFTAEVRLDVVLPPPLNVLGEQFVAGWAARDLDLYTGEILRRTTAHHRLRSFFPFFNPGNKP
jgi:hypothetical protein